MKAVCIIMALILAIGVVNATGEKEHLQSENDIYTDRKAFEARRNESVKRLYDNLGAIASPRNDPRLREYYVRQTLEMLDLEADSMLRLNTCYNDSIQSHMLPAVEFFNYLLHCSDSVPRLVEIKAPSFPEGGFWLDSLCSFSTAQVLYPDSCNITIAGTDSCTMLRTYWEQTICGEIPSPRFAALVVEMQPIERQSVILRTDTIDGHVQQVFGFKYLQ